MKKRWWIKEYQISDSGYVIIAGPRFWTYCGAKRRVARWMSFTTEDVTYDYTILRVTSDTPAEDEVIKEVGSR
jgi:hypothetical protein